MNLKQDKPKQISPSHIIIKLQKTKNKGKKIESSPGQMTHYPQENTNLRHWGFLSETMEASIFQALCGTFF